MRFLSEKIRKLNIGWNESPLSEQDFHRLCKRFRISVTEMPLRTDGFYYRVMGRDFIAVNSRLNDPMKLLVLFHELGHYLFHTPETGATASFHGIGGSCRKEREADIFALCALLPRSMLFGQSAGELLNDSGLPADKLAERFQILERYGL